APHQEVHRSPALRAVSRRRGGGTMKIRTSAALLALVSLAGACGPHIRPLERTMDNGELLHPRSEEVVEQARLEGEMERERIAADQAAAMAAALASCTPEICEAIGRGELAVGMTEAEVLAATRTTHQAW